MKRRQSEEQLKRQAFESAITGLQRIAAEAGRVAAQVRGGRDKDRVLGLVDDLDGLVALMSDHLKRFDIAVGRSFLRSGHAVAAALSVVVLGLVNGPLGEAGNAVVQEAVERIQGERAVIGACVTRYETKVVEIGVAVEHDEALPVRVVTATAEERVGPVVDSAAATVNPSIASMGAAVPVGTEIGALLDAGGKPMVLGGERAVGPRRGGRLG